MQAGGSVGSQASDSEKFNWSSKPDNAETRWGLTSTLISAVTPLMNHSDFSLGLEFCCGDKRWRCTDIGSRVVIAICLEPRDMVRCEVDPSDQSKRIQTRYVSDDLRDLNGPPYGVVESVFDEYDMVVCSMKQDTLVDES